MKVCSPELKLDRHKLRYTANSLCGETWFCFDGLQKYFNVPDDADTYWVEAYTEPVSESLLVHVRITCDGHVLYHVPETGESDAFYRRVATPLRRLGVGSKWATIYVCAYYE